ncbi:MAG: lamin tail domain-containing protein [Patescibacteria group bacterium]|nr:lamin tail domain-containing protein [Patescibacteria group bacterium]
MRKIIILLFFFTSFIFFIPRTTFANLFINEFSSDTAGTATDPDWVELYNSGPDSIELSLYRLRDSTTTNKIDLEGVINSQTFVSFDWSNKLNKSGDIIKLLVISNESDPVDQVAYGDLGNNVSAPLKGQSAGRETDGRDNWVIFDNPTKGASNNTSKAILVITLIPTSKPTPTQKPTPTLKPTHTPKPTPTSKEISGSSTKKQAETEVNESQNDNSSLSTIHLAVNKVDDSNGSESSSILGDRVLGSSGASTKSSVNKVSPTSIMKTLGSFKNNLSKIFIGFGVTFLIVCSILIFRSYKRLKKTKIDDQI